MSDLTLIESFFRTFGVPLGLLFLVLWTGARELWVFGHHYRRTIEAYEKRLDASQKREEEWRSLALRGANITAGAITVAAAATGQREGS